MTFETYLQNEYARSVQFTENDTLDDDSVDAFDDWLCELEPEEIIKLAEEWGNFRYMDGKIAAYKSSLELIQKCEV
jgi:hypothetical protein